MLFAIFNLLEFKARDLEKFFMRFSLILDSLLSHDILLWEPCLVINALCMHNDSEVHNYIQCSDSEIAKVLNDTIVKHWKGLLKSNYNTQIQNYHKVDTIQPNTILANVSYLNNFMHINFPTKHVHFEQYLTDYYLKIMFIDNFVI